MPQFDVTSFPTQLVWLLITFVLLYLLMSRVALPRIGSVLEERQKRIEGNLDAAEQLRKEADAELEAYEIALADAREQARGTVLETVKAANEESQERREELGRKLAADIKAAEARITEAKDIAIASVRDVAGEVAADATRRLIGVQPSPADVSAALDQVMRGRS